MITHVAEHNDKLYDALFADITSAISGVTVRTIEEYFLNLEAIAQYVIGTTPTNGHSDKTYFLRLPVDENMVAIDANTRTINLSEAYRKNGIAVVGDTYAETLWFKVDRYYDLQDLSLTNIYIFWELPDKTKGYSQPAFTDIHSEGGKLIFSWTIPELLTQTAGNVKFYVSFQAGTSNSNTYVFNTLTQTAKINSTLDAKLSDEAVASDAVTKSSILSRLRNTTNIGTIVVARPQISSCTSTTDVALLSASAASTYIDVYAYSSDNAAVLSYVLYKDGNSSGLTSTAIRTKTKDTVANPHKTYYSAATGTDTLDDLTNLAEAYEEGRRFVVTSKGSYQCQVIATISIDHDNNGQTAAISNTSAPAYTHRWVWETPTDFVVKNDAVVFENNTNGIISSASDNDKTLIITWPHDPKDSSQQQRAIYSAEVSVAPVTGGTAVATQTYTSYNNQGQPVDKTEVELGNPFVTAGENPSLVVGTSTVTVKFNKSLNKESVYADASRPQLTLNIQSEAKAYGANGITISPALVQTHANTTVTLDTTDINAAQTYWYCWQRQSGGNWVDATNLTQITNLSNPTFTDSFGTSGTYRLKIVTKFGKDTKETLSTAAEKLLTVYSVSN